MRSISKNIPVGYGSKPAGAVLASIFLAATISGCTMGSSLPVVETDASLITGSVTNPIEAHGVARTDAEIIKQTVTAVETENALLPIAWDNPDTGSSGSILSLKNFKGQHGQMCRGFLTSVQSFKGVALYDGETCRLSAKEWVLSWFRPSSGDRIVTVSTNVGETVSE